MYEQIKLSYERHELEPFIDRETIETHYGKHHAAYTNMFNQLADQAGMSDLSVEELLANLSKVSDPGLRQALKNQGGGYYNHNLYFEMFSPAPVKAPEGALAEAIDRDFGSLANVIEALSKAAVGQFGSGWSFLSTDNAGKLYVTASANQDNPISEGTGCTPLVALDVWEHAYYLKYKNLRADYIKAFFEILDWGKVSKRYETCLK